jgi:hypothetical protein
MTALLNKQYINIYVTKDCNVYNMESAFKMTQQSQKVSTTVKWLSLKSSRNLLQYYL